MKDGRKYFIIQINFFYDKNNFTWLYWQPIYTRVWWMQNLF